MSEEEIKDMSLEDTEEEKQKAAEKDIADMSLDEPQIPSALEIGTRLAKAFQGIDLIDTGELKVVRMMDNSYTVEGVKLEDLKLEDLAKIYDFLKKEEAK